MRKNLPQSGARVDNALLVLLGVLMIVSVSCLVWNTYASTSNSESFKQPLILYFFVLDGCGWCDKLKPEIIKVQQDMQQSSSVQVRILQFPPQTEAERQLGRYYSVNSFPAIILSRADQSKFWTYPTSSARDAQSIQQWVTQVSQ